MSTTQRNTNSKLNANNISIDCRLINGDYLRGQSTINSPPPGFVGSINSSESCYVQDRATEPTPPPPGFVRQETSHQNSRTNDRRPVDVNDITASLQMMNRNMRHPEDLLLPSNFCSNGPVECEKMRSKSYVKLADAVGEGLAESMGDFHFDAGRNGKKVENMGIMGLSTGRGLNRDGNNSNIVSFSRYTTSASKDMGLDNIARQTRHSLSRVTGRSTEISPSIVDGNGPGSVYHMGLDIDHDKTIPHTGTNSYPFLQSTLLTQDRLSSEDVSTDFYNINTGVGCIVEEPRSCTASPTPHQFQLNTADNSGRTMMKSANSGLNHLTEATEKLYNLNENRMGRASAPPMVVGRQTHDAGSPAISCYQSCQSLQERKLEIREFQQIPKTSDVQNMVSNKMLDKNTTSNYGNPAHMYNTQYEASPPSNRNVQRIARMEEDKKRHNDLVPFIWDVVNVSRDQQVSSPPSRALAIIDAYRLLISEVRSTCEAFGSLLYFRPEFCQTRGIILFAYHDMRSARHAAKELNSYLLRLTTPHHAQHSYQDNFKVMYCINLNSSAAINESMIKLSNLPLGVDDKSVNELIASYGAVRSIHFQAEETMGGENGASYTVEFYDIQDANQALLELQGMSPWGAGVIISQTERSQQERAQGRDLLSLIGRWRRCDTQKLNGSANILRAPPSPPPPPPPIPTSHISVQNTIQPKRLSSSPQSSSNWSSSNSNSVGSTSKGIFEPSRSVSEVPPHVTPYAPTPQLVIGADGHYSYVMMTPHAYATPSQYPQHGPIIPPMQHVQQHFVPGPQGTYVTSSGYHGQNYWLHPSQPTLTVPTPSQIPQYQHVPCAPLIPGQPYAHGYNIPVYGAPTASVPPITDSSLSSGNSSSGKFSPRSDNKEKTHLTLNFEAVKTGKDTRTSLMVRNIPNKYTQSMLLSEFTEGGHGPGTIDFFYLPIDFRNKCNRGYAFVNFVDFRDVVTFYQAYNGKHWKIFKSDKICDITYARIQGKVGMMKRFQNSALMEKDPEYRPLVFSSEGEDKGEIVGLSSSP